MVLGKWLILVVVVSVIGAGGAVYLLSPDPVQPPGSLPILAGTELRFAGPGEPLNGFQFLFNVTGVDGTLVGAWNSTGPLRAVCILDTVNSPPSQRLVPLWPLLKEGTFHLSLAHGTYLLLFSAPSNATYPITVTVTQTIQVVYGS